MNKFRYLPALITLVTVAGTLFLMGKFWPSSAEAESATTADLAPLPRASAVIRLSESKLAVAGITTVTVSRQTLPLTRTLPARFDYDDTLHVAVRAATDGVLDKVMVKPGDVVQAGQTIAILRSPQIGAARSDVMSQIAAVELAETESNWQSRIADAVVKLVKSIRSGESVEQIEARFENATLGEYRSKLLGNYSKSMLAKKLAVSATGVRGGAISGRIVEQRASEQQQTIAALDSTIEQSVFQTSTNKQKAEAELGTAQRRLQVARQTLATLLGVTANAKETSGGVSAEVSADEQLARLEVRSPLAGTVERRVYSASERVTGGAEMFIIADTSRLWVEADIRGRDWSAIEVNEGDLVIVTTPANEHARLEANVYFVGREVDPASGAIPLVARVANKDGKYRPGLFARMEVPIGEITDTLVVPDASLIDLDGQTSVFLQQKEGFVPVAVEVGNRSGTSVEIRDGLREGQSVVVEGAFVLKSELLLEGGE